MLEHRLQVLLDEDRHRRLRDLAQERGVSVATVVREAIDRGLTRSGPARRSAGDAVLAAEPVPVPEVTDLVAELDDLRGRRG